MLVMLFFPSSVPVSSVNRGSYGHLINSRYLNHAGRAARYDRGLTGDADRSGVHLSVYGIDDRTRLYLGNGTTPANFQSHFSGGGNQISHVSKCR